MLTLDFIRENFEKINQKHFGNELMMPRFEITHVKSYLGQYHWRYGYDGRLFADSVIRISDMFDRTDEDIINTIAHEMIHLYIRQNKLRDTRPHHGTLFYSIANRLNREGGFHIARTDSVEGCGLRNNKGKKFIVCCYFSSNLNSYFRFVINEKYINDYLLRFKNSPSFYKDAIIIVSTDDKTYANYTKCYRAIRGFRVTKDEYESMKAEKMLFNYCKAA